MRGFWIGLSAAVTLGCGGDPVAHQAGAGGHSGHGGAAHASAGRPSVGGSGGTGSSGGSGGTVSAGAGMGTAGRFVSDGGQPEEAAGAGGEAAEGGAAGVPGDDAGAGGQPSSGGGSGGKPTASAGAPGVAGSAPIACDCDAAHECVDGECVIKPECDCAALKVACGPLSTAMSTAFACPVEVQCGECGTAHLCVGTNDEATYGRRICEAPAPSSCEPWTTYIEPRGWPPVCPPPSGGDERCSVPYLYCTRIYLPDGTPCPMPDGTDQGLAIFCGPPP